MVGRAIAIGWREGKVNLELEVTLKAVLRGKFSCPALFKTKLKKRTHPKKANFSIRDFLVKVRSHIALGPTTLEFLARATLFFLLFP